MTKNFGKILQTFIDMNKDVPLGEREWVEYFHDMRRILSGKNLRIRVFHGSLEPNGRVLRYYKNLDSYHCCYKELIKSYTIIYKKLKVEI